MFLKAVTGKVGFKSNVEKLTLYSCLDVCKHLAHSLGIGREYESLNYEAIRHKNDKHKVNYLQKDHQLSDI